MLFGSLVLPLAVLMSLPLALVGAFGAMALTGTPLTLFALLGFAVLVGLVGKNAILLVDYTEILMQRGYARNAALLEAGPTRLRPIIMTTMSVIVALLPIVSGLEEGSELLQAAAVVLIGGLLTSTLLTLVFVPAMFTVFDDMQRVVVRLFRRGKQQEVATAGAAHEAPAHGAVPVAVAAHNGSVRAGAAHDGRGNGAAASPEDATPTPDGVPVAAGGYHGGNGQSRDVDGREVDDGPGSGVREAAGATGRR